MAEQLAAFRPVHPRAASVRTLAVQATSRPFPGFARVTLRSTGDGFEDDFEYLGFDHWFRLFLTAPDGTLDLPMGGAEGWYSRLLDIEESHRPVVRNYTIRDARRVGEAWELDVDFVIHRDTTTGEVDGRAARWALDARPGDRVGMLDQGRIFNVEGHTGPLLVVADESGLPGIEGIARSLAGAPCDYVLEVPDAADRRELSGADPVWTVRVAGEDAGEGVLEHLRSRVITPDTRLYVVGEASFVLAARSLALNSGVPKDNVQFCAYWRVGRRAKRN
ncbi:siderophore-interacting protein [Nocardiopsis sp. MG754419]|uniref:siderophore-interacting protein n=1 Tax=Nocardiopsis sp. MG754419 TaxID=2259865 RepID=UPI001BA93C3E|nr:siderophore-interacting protein [Nocardiopsis sp. MG754419]MBR8743052.1 siderophore-interacting protein [Nocardiopsis sp. MG754419]